MITPKRRGPSWAGSPPTPGAQVFPLQPSVEIGERFPPHHRAGYRGASSPVASGRCGVGLLPLSVKGGVCNPAPGGLWVRWRGRATNGGGRGNPPGVFAGEIARGTPEKKGPVTPQNRVSSHPPLLRGARPVTHSMGKPRGPKHPSPRQAVKKNPPERRGHHKKKKKKNNFKKRSVFGKMKKQEKRKKGFFHK